MTDVPDQAAAGTVTDDVFLGGALSVLQPARAYRAGLDAVLLAASVRPPAAACRSLDAGAGVGVAGLCLARRLPAIDVTLVEREPELVSLARRNIDRNDLAARARVVEADVCAPAAMLAEAGLLRESYGLVLANPPYLEEGTGRSPAGRLRAGANVMSAGDLERWVRFFATMLEPFGMLALVHRADALSRLLDALDGRFGGIEILPAHPRLGAPANRLLLQAVKGSRAPVKLHQGLVVHDDSGHFTPALEAVLRSGAGLAWPAA